MPTGQGFLFLVAILGILVVRLLLRELRVRRIPLNRLFVLPAFFGLAVIFLVVTTLQQDPSQLFELAIGAPIALVVGAGIGLAVAHFTTVRAGPSPGIVLVRGSTTTVAIWIAALLLRLVPRWILGTTVHSTGTTLMLNALLLVMLAVAVCTVRLQILRRARSGLLEPFRQRV